MPYKIKEQTKDEKKEWCVINKETGDKKGCSDSHEKAVAHMRALYKSDKS